MIHLHQPGTWIFGSWSSWAWQAIHKWFHNRNQQQLDQLHNQPRFDSLCHSLRHPLCNSRNSAFGWDPISFASWKKHVFVSKQWSSILLNTSKPEYLCFYPFDSMSSIGISSHLEQKWPTHGCNLPQVSRHHRLEGWSAWSACSTPHAACAQRPKRPKRPKRPECAKRRTQRRPQCCRAACSGCTRWKILRFLVSKPTWRNPNQKCIEKIPKPKDGIYQLMYKHVFGWLGCNHHFQPLARLVPAAVRCFCAQGEGTTEMKRSNGQSDF